MVTTEKIEDLRAELDTLDRELVAIFAKRARVTDRVIEVKKREVRLCDEDVFEGAAGEPGFDGCREVLGCALGCAEQRMRETTGAQRDRDPWTLG